MEWWAGNGGQVAETKKELASKTRGRTSRKKAVPRGVRTLREAAGNAVGRNSAQLTQRLLDRALAGDLNSAKLLVALADLQPENEDSGKSRRGLSAAQELAAEPEWQETLSEATAETRGGSREPEG